MPGKLQAAAFVLAAAAALAAPVEIDRIAAIAGKEAIKTSDIDRDLRLTAFLNDERPVLNAETRRTSAERLVDQAILRQEIARGSYAPPSKNQVDGLLNQIQRERFGGSGARLRDALARDQLTEDELRDRLRWQLTVLRFIEQRFRAAVLVTDEDAHAYYDAHRAELARQSGGDSSFAALEPKLRETLEEERANQNFAEWQGQARKRYRIEIKPEAFS